MIARRRRRLPGLEAGLTLLVGAVCALPGAAQQPQPAKDNLLAQDLANPSSPVNTLPPPPPQFPLSPNLAGIPTVYSTNPPFTAKQLELINEARQKSMVANTNKLLKLAKELNAEVNGTSDGPLSVDELRRVKEIEKLAHKVKDEMQPVVKKD